METRKPYSTAPLILKRKKTPVFKVFNTPLNGQTADPPKTEDSIEYDWGEAERHVMFVKDAFAFQNVHPTVDPSKYTIKKWVSDMREVDLSTLECDQMPLEEVLSLFKKMEIARKAFFYEEPVLCNGSYIGAHPPEFVPYPLSYDAVAQQTDRHSYKLLKKIYYGLPSIHGTQFTEKPLRAVLDLGCGDGSWIIDAAQSWTDTRFCGIDLQRFYPAPEQLTEKYGDEAAKRIKFIEFNFLLDKLPFLDGVFQMVRMANLKWCIPENKWEDILKEVHRVTARGGLVEIIDDDFVTYTATDANLTGEELTSCHALESQFAEVLSARNLPLDTRQLLCKELPKFFVTFHQDVFPVAISPEMGIRVPKKTRKTAKRHSDDSKDEDGNFLKRRITRSRKGSDSNSEAEEKREVEVERPLPPKPRPLGLVVTDRFLPCTADELFAHATKNMQSVLSAMETTRKYLIPKNSVMESLRLELVPTQEQREEYEEMFDLWKKETTEFEDMFWFYETTMADRLNIHIPQCGFDSFEEEDPTDGRQPPVTPRSMSTIGEIRKGRIGRFWDDDHESIARELSADNQPDKLVRVIRVYTMWK